MTSFDKFSTKLFGDDHHTSSRIASDNDKPKKTDSLFLKRVKKYRKLKMKVIPSWSDPAYGAGWKWSVIGAAADATDVWKKKEEPKQTISFFKKQKLNPSQLDDVLPISYQEMTKKHITEEEKEKEQ